VERFGAALKFDTLTTDFQFVNIVIEPHSIGTIAAYSDDFDHENVYFRVNVQQAEGMAEFCPIGDFKIVSSASLPTLVRQLSLVADWYAKIFKDTVRDTERNEQTTNWRARLEAIKKFANSIQSSVEDDETDTSESGIMKEEKYRDFTPGY